MRHEKFLALNGNAIALWDEIKDYCDERHTDGFVPKEAFKTFRFAGQRSLALLTTSCGFKPDKTPFAPLLEEHELGYRMHDYLDHNDCRDAVLARMERAEAKKEDERARKAEWRAKKADKSHGTKRGTPRGRPTIVPPSVTAVSRSMTEAESESERTTDPNAPQKSARGPVGEFLVRYSDLFSERFDTRPDIQGGRDGKIAKNTIAKHGQEKAIALLQQFFASDDKFILGTGYGLNIFAGQINKLLTELARPIAVQRSAWNCPHIDQCSHRPMCEVKLTNPTKYPVKVAS